MKYFIDFEATQYNHEIISVGCIREDGKTFYSLVKPKKLNSLTKFITELTGITKEMLQEEEQSDEVFSKFYDWLVEDSGYLEFYCYGNCDIDFLKKNLKDRTSTFKSQAALSLMAMNLVDYSEIVKKHFGLIKCIALKKVADYFGLEENIIVHNALDDAIMLKKVFDGINNQTEINGIPFPEYMGIPTFLGTIDFEKYYIQRGEVIYNSMEEAVDWAKWEMLKNGIKNFNENNISKKIIHAINTKKLYFNQKWIAKIRGIDSNDGN
jgi:inhibitor of KinA sporulation pathway (predicted exonuclease)